MLLDNCHTIQKNNFKHAYYLYKKSVYFKTSIEKFLIDKNTWEVFQYSHSEHSTKKKSSTKKTDHKYLINYYVYKSLSQSIPYSIEIKIADFNYSNMEDLSGKHDLKIYSSYMKDELKEYVKEQDNHIFNNLMSSNKKAPI